MISVFSYVQFSPQARPRRRSGEICGAQDLTKGPNSLDPEAAENLSLKKNNNLPLSRPASSPSPSSVNNVSLSPSCPNPSSKISLNNC